MIGRTNWKKREMQNGYKYKIKKKWYCHVTQKRKRKLMTFGGRLIFNEKRNVKKICKIVKYIKNTIFLKFYYALLKNSPSSLCLIITHDPLALLSAKIASYKWNSLSDNTCKRFEWIPRGKKKGHIFIKRKKILSLREILHEK